MRGNSNKQPPRPRHIDIQYFAVQDWVKEKRMRLFHISGVVNPADALTKAQGYVLHHHHVTRAMGLCGSPFTSTYGQTPCISARTTKVAAISYFYHFVLHLFFSVKSQFDESLSIPR